MKKKHPAVKTRQEGVEVYKNFIVIITYENN